MQKRYEIGDSFGVNRALSNGFRAVRVALAPMWVGGLLVSISDGCGAGLPGNLRSLFKGHDRAATLLTNPPRLPQALLDALDRGDLWGWVLGLIVAFVLAALLMGLALFALSTFIHTGFVRLHLNILEHESDELNPLFSGKDRFWAMAGFKLLAGFSTTAAAIVAAWPGALLAFVGYILHRRPLIVGGVGLALLLALPAAVYVALGTFLGEHAVVLERASPSHALRRAFALARGNRLQLFVFACVCGLLQFVSVSGILLCCVGLLATVPLARAVTGFAKTESFLLFTRGREQAQAWKLWQRQAREDGLIATPVAGWGQPPEVPREEPPDPPPDANS